MSGAVSYVLYFSEKAEVIILNLLVIMITPEVLVCHIVYCMRTALLKFGSARF